MGLAFIKNISQYFSPRDEKLHNWKKERFGIQFLELEHRFSQGEIDT